MKAAGITLSTVGAGGGSNPFLEQLAKHGGGRFYDAANVELHPRHLPQGDPAGRRPADRRGDVLPDPDRSSSPILRGLEDGLPAAARLQRHDDQVGRPAGPRLAARRSAPRPVAVRPRAFGGLDVRLDRPLGARTGSAGRASAGSSASSWRGRSRARRRAASRPSFETLGGQTRLHVESVEADGSPRDFYRTTRGPRRAGLRRPRRHARPGRAGRVRGRPGRDRLRAPTPSGSPRPGPGAPPLGRTVGLVAPIAAEYRLARRRTCRSCRAPRRDGRARDRAADSSRGSTTSRTTSSLHRAVALLLVLALLLWPLDIALRRVSIGRREFAAAGGWVRAIPRRRGRTAARTAAGEGLFAARDRARRRGLAPRCARLTRRFRWRPRPLAGWSRDGTDRHPAPGRAAGRVGQPATAAPAPPAAPVTPPAAPATPPPAAAPAPTVPRPWPASAMPSGAPASV